MNTDIPRSPRVRILRALAVLLVFLLIGFLAGFVFRQADEDKKSGPEVTDKVAPVFCIEDNGIPCDLGFASRWSAGKFRAGAMSHHRFRPNDLFLHPAATRLMIIRAIRREYAKPKNARFRNISAATRYANTVANANCVRKYAYHPYTTGFSVCGGPKITRHDVQKIGAVGLCAGAVVLAIPTGLSTLEIGLGAGACAWGFWMTADPG